MDGRSTIALVVANGSLPSQEVIASLLSLHPFVLAADGGANKLLERGILPDAVLGDFDSLDGSIPDSVERISAPDQNFTDLDKALAFLHKRGFATVYIVGATGDRLDHTFGALTVLVKYREIFEVALVDDIGTARPVVGSLAFDAAVGQTVSLLALGTVSSITTKGLRWELHDESLSPGVRDGISNEAAANEVEIRVGSGSLIVYIHHG